MIRPVISFLVVAACAATVHAAEIHVALTGNDANPGTAAAPLRTIQHAADRAQPGDVVTVHAGVYRERINPPRGGESDARRIVYQAAPGEKVEIKGSEVVKNWVHVQNDTWKATLPASFFGRFNPYSDLIHGDWFEPRGRPHHTGAVYLDGQWLIEATRLEEVLAPAANRPAWLGGSGGYLLNVAWLKPAQGGRVHATAFTAKRGTQNAPCTEGGQCIGFIEHGHWVRYEQVDFGTHSEAVEIRAASEAEGGMIELRRGAADGELLGTCLVPNTGGWQAWSSFPATIKPVSGRQTLCLVFRDREPEPNRAALWFAQVDKDQTTLWAQFPGTNPSERQVEINVRRTVFYPDRPGRDYITVRGFTLRDAATPWAPPTAEQVGLIGTHWSKGWIIEDNVISHSTCCGIALGKYGDRWDNTSANTAEGYVKTIERALANGWSRDRIGHHIVRNNTISHCEQTGVVGSLGAAFSTVTGNSIHDIHVRRLFTGAEMAGIKFHAAIDVVISHNRIERTCLGVWLDWMAQGTRVSSNLFRANGMDLFVEVDHGPFLVDNNLFLSPATLLSHSQGGAFVHNLVTGSIRVNTYDSRLTPFHKPHSTEVAGMHDNPKGDDRWYNNVFAGRADLSQYDDARLPVMMDGNVFLHGARPSKYEAHPVVEPGFDPAIQLLEKPDGLYLEARRAPTTGPARPLVTTALLGKSHIASAAYERPDGSPLAIDEDYLGKPRRTSNPTPGPIEDPGGGRIVVKVR